MPKSTFLDFAGPDGAFSRGLSDLLPEVGVDSRELCPRRDSSCSDLVEVSRWGAALGVLGSIVAAGGVGSEFRRAAFGASSVGAWSVFAVAVGGVGAGSVFAVAV